MAFGRRRRARQRHFVAIGTGIGAGLTSTASSTAARRAQGDVGHIQVLDDPSVVRRVWQHRLPRGRRGALARIATEMAARDGNPSLARGASSATAASRRATSPMRRDAVNPKASSCSSARVGSCGMLAGLVNFFNPSLIVVGGGVADAGDVLLATIRETVYGRSLPLATRELVIQRSSLGSLAGVTEPGDGGRPAVLLESLARWIDIELRPTRRNSGRWRPQDYDEHADHPDHPESVRRVGPLRGRQLAFVRSSDRPRRHPHHRHDREPLLPRRHDRGWHQRPLGNILNILVQASVIGSWPWA